MGAEERRARFEASVLTHLDAAYNLARWLTRDDAGAQDAVQDACLKALRFFDSQHGPSPKAWFMSIVRNASLDWLRERQRGAGDEQYDDQSHAGGELPETTASRAQDARHLHECVAALPVEYREVLVLREFEGLSYREIAAIVDVPAGTVMSRLSRGRDLLQRRLLGSRRQVKP